MRRSIQSKLILSYLAVALLTVLVVILLIRLTSSQTLKNLVQEQQTAQLKETVQDYYISNGTLDGFFDYYVEYSFPEASSPKPPTKPFMTREIRGVFGLIDVNNKAVLPTLNYQVGQTVAMEFNSQVIPVEVDGKAIAWILKDSNPKFKFSPEEEAYLSRTTFATGLAALAGVVAAVLMGVFLSSRLLKPIRMLTNASRSLAKGDLEQNIPVISQDELGQLTTTFNQMSADLFRADQQRKRMTADITHDLSTPLQIISGYIEMLEEGDITLSPQRLETIKVEIEHLRRLVGDMTTLTQVETDGLEMQLEPVSAAALLKKAYGVFQPIAAREDINLVLNVAEKNDVIRVDEGRMFQVLSNLIENAIRHTPRGGEILLGVTTGEDIVLRVQDSGTGIEPEDLPYVFDRFYRADKARAGITGKMGLGLAICKAMVNAQGGRIRAESGGRGMGTSILIDFVSETA